jgi:hypothetical protein
MQRGLLGRCHTTKSAPPGAGSPFLCFQPAIVFLMHTLTPTNAGVLAFAVVWIGRACMC